MEWIFGYTASGHNVPTRPAVILHGLAGADDSLEVKLWVIEGWQEWADPQRQILRKPPVRWEFDHRDGGDRASSDRVVPSYLEGVTSSEQRLQIARQQILTHWGTADPETDFNCDGTTDEADLEAAEALFSAATGG